jgi:hypothetical protein
MGFGVFSITIEKNERRNKAGDHFSGFGVYQDIELEKCI